MDYQEMLEPATPASSYSKANVWRSEDSGYTSHTPGTIECEISNENLDPIQFIGDLNVGSASAVHEGRKYRRFKSTPLPSYNEKSSDSTKKRRGIKRPYEADTDILETSFSSIPTPTSVIAGGIQRLHVHDVELSPDINGFAAYSDTAHALSYPTTPVKKVYKNSSKLSTESYNDSVLSSPLRTINNICCPPRRSAKKLSFVSHTLPGEIQQVNEAIKKTQSKVVRTIFKPEKKVDIIEALYEKVCCMPAIVNIFSYLSSEDIYNFSLVSQTWLGVCEKVTEAKLKKQDYVEFINNTKENYENRNNKRLTESLDNCDRKQKEAGCSLKDIHNVVNHRHVKRSPNRSPPSTPRTMRFKRFTKSASLDSRVQLQCTRCRQPAKVTEEESGEEWAECTNTRCSYQFCRYCKCDRHPGKTCFRYDLNEPSPSKRRKHSCVIGTKKSKRNLRRLL